MLYWFLKYVVIGPVVKLIWRPWVKGAENIPKSGGALLASNHLSFSDSVFLPVVMRRRVTFLAKAEYFTTPGIKGFFSRMFFSGIGQVPIDRRSAAAAAGALSAGARLLTEGQLVGIYPEGTRSPDGRLYKGKVGVARLAMEAGVPVIPVVMVDTDRVQPTGRRLPHLRPRPGVIVGQPLDFTRYQNMVGDRYVERSITDEIMYELMRISGREYVDVYASKVKRLSGTKTFGSSTAATEANDEPDQTSSDRLPTDRAIG